MTLLNDKEISDLAYTRLLVSPFTPRKEYVGALSYGLGTCGYDVRIGSWLVKWYSGVLVDPCQNQVPEYGAKIDLTKEGFILLPGCFVLATTYETIDLPGDIEGSVKDKSTLARLGLAVQNTVLEPGWRGEITLELSNHGPHKIVLREGMPIAQVQFRKIEWPLTPYDGRYQNQEGVTLAKKKVA